MKLTKEKFFYGWIVVIAGFLNLFIMTGFGFYCFGVMFNPLSEMFGWSRTQLSVAQSVFVLTSGIGGMLASKLLKKYKVRNIIMLGGIIGVIGFFMLSLVNSLVQLYLAYGLVGLGVGGFCGYIPVASIVSKWFDKKKGLAMGITMSGMSIGSLLTVPLISYIVLENSFRVGFVAMGSISIVLYILIFFMLKYEDPKEINLNPDNVLTQNDIIKEKSEEHTEKDEIATVNYIGDYKVWLIAISFILVGISYHGILTNEVPFLIDLGIPSFVAGSMYGIAGSAGAFGNLFLGVLTDKIHTKFVVMITFLGQAIGTFMLMNSTSRTSAFIAIIVLGFFIGAVSSMLPLTIGKLYSKKQFESVYGFVNLLYLGISIFGPPLAGIFFDSTGTYDVVFKIFIVAYLIASVLILFLWRKEK